MDRNELESPLSLPTAKLEQHDSEYMKENFNISETLLQLKWGFESPLLYFVMPHSTKPESSRILVFTQVLIFLLLYLMSYFLP